MPGFNRIWKGLLMAGGIVLGVGLLILLIAAMNSKSAKPCSDIVISFKNQAGPLYTGKTAIAKMLNEKGLSVWKGKPIKSFDLKSLEEKLEKDPWIRNAELFFDNQRVLRVNIEENEPVARVFTVKGHSFYIDSNLLRLPLNERYTPRLPVFTGFPGERYPWKGKDSLMMEQVKDIALYLKEDPFWMAQIDQCDINQQRGFDLVPKIGDHLILLGDGSDIAERFRKLTIFYQQVLAKTGFNTYKEINVQYAGQVVATKRNARYLPGDTAQSRQWMRQWLAAKDSSTLNPKPKKEVIPPSSLQSVPVKPKEPGNTPKAVMPQSLTKKENQ